MKRRGKAAPGTQCYTIRKGSTKETDKALWSLRMLVSDVRWPLLELVLRSRIGGLTAKKSHVPYLAPGRVLSFSATGPWRLVMTEIYVLGTCQGNWHRTMQEYLPKHVCYMKRGLHRTIGAASPRVIRR